MADIGGLDVDADELVRFGPGRLWLHSRSFNLPVSF